MQFSFNQRASLVTVTLHGELTLETMKGAFARLVNHPEFEPGMNAIWDLRQTTINIRPGDPSKLAEYVRTRRSSRGSRYRLAMVAQTSEQWSMARTYQLVSAPLPFEFRIFRDEKAAREWQLAGSRESTEPAQVITAIRQLGQVFSPQGV